jgi:hypothetical protein
METSVHRRLYWLAVLLLAVGLLGGGIFPVSSGGTSCGSAFFDRTGTSTDVEIDSLAGQSGVQLGAGDCDGARSTWRTIYIVALVAGGVLLAAGWVTAGAGRSRRDDG